MNYYVIENNNPRELSDRDLMRAYFLSGFQNADNAGKLSFMHMDGGTTLSPVIDENGHTPCYPEYAGKDVQDIDGVTTENVRRFIQGKSYEPEYTYERQQVNKAEASHDWTYSMQIQIRGNLDKTNWLSISKGQLDQIAEILNIKQED